MEQQKTKKSSLYNSEAVSYEGNKWCIPSKESNIVKLNFQIMNYYCISLAGQL